MGKKLEAEKKGAKAKDIATEADIDIDQLDGAAVCEHVAVGDICVSSKGDVPNAKSKMATSEEGKVDTFEVSCWDKKTDAWAKSMAKETGDTYTCGGQEQVVRRLRHPSQASNGGTGVDHGGCGSQAHDLPFRCQYRGTKRRATKNPDVQG